METKFRRIDFTNRDELYFIAKTDTTIPALFDRDFSTDDDAILFQGLEPSKEMVMYSITKPFGMTAANVTMSVPKLTNHVHELNLKLLRRMYINQLFSRKKPG